MPQVDFRWLHLSDLHAGQSGQNLLWPSVKHAAFEDFKRLYERVGPWDLVIFSGDLTYSGSQEQYAEVTNVLKEMWGLFAKWGFEPKLLAIPGNHDVRRPLASEPRTILLGQWFEQSSVRKDFFSGVGQHGYRSLVEASLETFTTWYRGLPDDGIPVLGHRGGALPGDQLAVLKSGLGQIGLVGLNSTWLQLTSEDAKGHLNVALEQLSDLESDPEAWRRLNDLNILVTHHPSDWLHLHSLAAWRSDIDPPGRFDLHLFGHMHQGKGISIAESGALPRNTIQAPSLFGMEWLADGSTERKHGYTLGQFILSGRKRIVRMWPRTARLLHAGNRVVGADQDFQLGDGEYYEIQLKDSEQTLPDAVLPAEAAPSFVAVPIEPTSGDLLAKARYTLPRSRAHREVRRAEQEQCLASIEQKRCAWVISEWGMGADEFVGALISRGSEPDGVVFKLDVSEFPGLETFISNFPQIMGCSLAQFVERLSLLGPATLLLDDVPTNFEESEHGIGGLISAVLPYCGDLTLLMRSRVRPRQSSFGIHELKPLDEADLKTYLANHEKGGTKFVDWDTVVRLHAYTDGIPTRVDEALRELEVVGLSELRKDDASANSVSEQTAPLALRKAVQGLAETDERQTRRSLELLQALTVFPKGVQLAAISRFNGVHAFFPKNALQLMDLGLVVGSELRGMAASSEIERGKLLVVPHPVRDYVRSLFEADFAAELDRKAAELFFGASWVSGTFVWPPAHNYESPKCSNEDIANASALIHRLLVAAINACDDRQIDAVTALVGSFAKSLGNGDHYLSLANLCHALIPVLEASGRHEDRLAMTKFRYGEALRMTGRRELAKEALRQIEDYPFPNSVKQDLLLTIALCNEGPGDENAIETAKRVVRINKNSSHGTHAQSLILQLTLNEPDKIKKLEALEQLAKKKKHYNTANNIALYLAEESDNPEEVDNILSRVIKESTKSNDFYNGMRALIKRSRRVLSAGGSIKESEHASLIACYQFLFNEKMDALFDSCTEVLWQSFTQRGETANLLALFRHSSLVWRLRGADAREQSYVARLRAVVDATIRAALSHDRVVAYFLVRAADS